MMLIIGGVIALVLIGVLAYFLLGSDGGSAGSSTGGSAKSPEFFPSTGNYQDSVNICTSKGLQVCGIKDICPGGPITNPLGGMRNSDQWLPAGNSSNDYISVGNYDPKNRLCRLHSESLGSKPGWAKQQGNFSFRKEVACCPA